MYIQLVYKQLGTEFKSQVISIHNDIEEVRQFTEFYLHDFVRWMEHKQLNGKDTMPLSRGDMDVIIVDFIHKLSCHYLTTMHYMTTEGRIQSWIRLYDSTFPIENPNEVISIYDLNENKFKS